MFFMDKLLWYLCSLFFVWGLGFEWGIGVFRGWGGRGGGRGIVSRGGGWGGGRGGVFVVEKILEELDKELEIYYVEVM